MSATCERDGRVETRGLAVQLELAVSDGSKRFRSTIAGAIHALVAEHVVQGRVIFPGAGYLEMARAASEAALRSVFFLQPLAPDAVDVVECTIADHRFEVQSSDAAADGVAVHCTGAISADGRAWSHSVDHASVLGCWHVCAVEIGALYKSFDAVGLQYGPSYRTLEQTWGSGVRVATARLRARPTQQGTQVHPADLDDALCTIALVSSGESGGTRLPFAVDDVALHGSAGRLWAMVDRQLGAEGVSVLLGAVARQAQARLSGFKSRALQASLCAKTL